MELSILLEEIGQMRGGVTRENIRQIEARAIERMQEVVRFRRKVEKLQIGRVNF